MATNNSQSLAQNELSVVPAKNARRARSMTMLKLDWLAERVRRTDRIRAEVAAGTYQADSKQVARAVLGLPTDRLSIRKN